MKNAIFNNAYGVLGLLPNATQKELSRRVKELDKLLQIGEVPSYDYDFDTFKNLRNEKGIKAANDELANISRQILHSFFRVYISSEIHANALQRLAQSGEGIRDFYNSKDSWDFISKKNFAIAATLYMRELSAASFALSLWDELLNAPAHLKTFQKLFLSDDELSVSESHFEGLKERLIIELSRVFKEVADETSEQSILASFVKKFGTQNLDENIGKEGFDELKKALAILEKLDISADGVYDDEEKATIKKCLKMFENGFEKLKNLGLYDSSKCLQIRDLAIKKIRAQSLDLHNNLSQSEESLKLTEFAMKISGSQSTKSQLEQDFAALKRHNEPIQKINFGEHHIVVYGNYLKFDGETIAFDDIQAISYSVNVEYVNGIKSNTTYTYTLNNHFVTASVGITKSVINFFKGKNDTEEEFYKIVSVLTLVAQIMAKKLYASLLAGNTLKMGELYITKNSYYKFDGFLCKREISISPFLQNPIISEGKVILYDDKNNEFCNFSIGEANAIVLYELVKMLKTKNVDVSRINKNFSIVLSNNLRICNDPETTAREEEKTANIKIAIKIIIISAIIVFLIKCAG